MSTRPYLKAVASYIACTLLGSLTSALKKNASLHSDAVFSPASCPTSATHTFAPSDEKRIAASRPMPPAAPVITATFPSNLPIGRHEDVLHLRVAVHRMHAQLAAEARLLHAAEGGGHAHRAVGVHREHARVDRPGDSHRARAVAGPDRTRQPELGVVCDAHSVGLVLEWDHGGDGTEHLFLGDAVIGPRLDDRARVPVARAGRHRAPEERLAVDERGHLVAVTGRDERTHLGVRRLGVADLHAPRGGGEQGEELVVHGALDEDPRASAAVLACVAEHR